MSDPKNVYQRMLDIMSDCDGVKKTKGRSELFPTAKHDDVTKAIRPLLVKHGILMVPSVENIEISEPWEFTNKEGKTKTFRQTDVTMLVQFVNVDVPEEKIEVRTCGTGIDDQDKGVGKATSYAVKYAVLKVFCVGTGDDSDHDQDYRGAPSQSSRQRSTGGGGKSNGGERNVGDAPDGCISEKQAKRLFAISKDVEMPTAVLQDLTAGIAGVSNSREIPWGKYEELIERVQKWTPPAPPQGGPLPDDDGQPCDF